MAMTNGNSGTLKIPVVIEAQDSASSALQSVAGGLSQISGEMQSVKDSAAGVSREFQQIDGYEQYVKASTAQIDGELRKVKDTAAGVTQGFASASNGAKQMVAGMEASTGKTTYLMQNLGRVISDMPYGIQGIGNNIQPLAESFRMVAAEAGGGRAAIQAVIASLGGPTGLLMVGLPIVTSLAIAFSGPLTQAIKGSGDSVDDLKGRLAGLAQYKDFDLSIRIAGADGLKKLQLQMAMLLKQKALLANENAKADELAALGDESWLSALTPGGMIRAIDRKRKADEIKARYQGKEIQNAWDVYKGRSDYGDDNERLLKLIRPNPGKTLLYDARGVSYWAQGRSLSDEQIQNIVARNRKDLQIAENKASQTLATEKERERASNRAAHEAETEAERAENRYQRVLQNLDAERIKLTGSAEEYQAYQEIVKAGIPLDGKQAETIREKVKANEELKKSQKEVTDFSKALFDINGQIDKQKLSTRDYELERLLTQAGVTKDSAEGQYLAQKVEELHQAKDDLGKAFHDNFAKWIDNMDVQLNNLVWNSKTSFADIGRSFAQMATQMAIKWAMIKPLESALGIKFAAGGIMTDQGPMELRRYANGGVANSPQLTMFGEGRTPEAFVPLPDGRSIPVDWRGGSRASAPVNVQVQVVNNSGQKISQQTSSRFDGKDYIVTTVLEAVGSNYNGSGEALASMIRRQP